MVRSQLQGQLEFVAPSGRRLSGPPVDQVDRERAEPRLARDRDGSARILDPMGSTEKGQPRGVQRLDSETERGDPQLGPGAGVRGRHVLGVRFEEDPGVLDQPQARPRGGDDPRQVRGLERGGRAPTEVDGVEDQGMAGMEFDLGQQGIDEPPAPRAIARAHGEIAVGADPGAERNVQVQPGERLAQESVTVLSTATKADCGISTAPTVFMRFLPSFCFSRSLRLRVMSPP